MTETERGKLLYPKTATVNTNLLLRFGSSKVVSIWIDLYLSWQRCTGKTSNQLSNCNDNNFQYSSNSCLQIFYQAQHILLSFRSSPSGVV
ncbi:hypothetical protein MHYP_G00179310 [Metynnis hypsauchen]